MKELDGCPDRRMSFLPQWVQAARRVSRPCRIAPRLMPSWLVLAMRVSPLPVAAGGYTRPPCGALLAVATAVPGLALPARPSGSKERGPGASLAVGPRWDPATVNSSALFC